MNARLQGICFLCVCFSLHIFSLRALGRSGADLLEFGPIFADLGRSRATNLYYKVRLRTTRCEFVLQGTIFCEVRLCTTRYDFVLQGTTLYYKVLRGATLYYEGRLCTTRYDFRQGAASSYKVRLCTISYDFELQATTLCTQERICITRYAFEVQGKVRLCTTRYEFVLLVQGTTLPFQERLRPPFVDAVSKENVASFPIWFPAHRGQREIHAAKLEPK